MIKTATEHAATSDVRAANATNVVLVGLRKTYVGGNGNAVDLDRLEIQKGEFLTLTGPSGCGKSTMLRMVAGLEQPSAGEIYFGERRVTNVSVQKRNVSLMFQNYALYPSMKVAANLAYGMKKHHVGRATRDARVAEVAEMLGISHLLDRRPRQLSGGEQQRVALGRAIVRNPDVLLLDEPLSNLDAQMRATLRAEIVRVHRQVGSTTMFVTHDQLEALTMSDRIAVMRLGVIEQIGTPEEVYDRPATRFVAGFIGSPAMNFIAGTVRQEASGAYFETTGGRLPMERIVDVPAPPNVAGEMTLGVRPDEIRFVPQAQDGLRYLVTLVQLIGSERQIFLSGDTGDLIVRTPASYRIDVGEAVTCAFNPGKTHLFDASGRRVDWPTTPESFPTATRPSGKG